MPFKSFTSGYDAALKKAAEASAAESKYEAQRKAKDDPAYVIGSVLEPFAHIADIPLAIAGMPPVAGAAVSGLKGLAGAAAGVEGADASKSAGALGDAQSAFMKWQAAQDAKKKKQSFMDEMQMLIKSQAPAGGKPAPAAPKKPVSTGEMEYSLDDIMRLLG